MVDRQGDSRPAEPGAETYATAALSAGGPDTLRHEHGVVHRGLSPESLRLDTIPNPADTLRRTRTRERPDPGSSASLRGLGRVYQTLGRAEEAQRYREQADECGPDQPIQPLVEGLDWTLAVL